MATQDLRPAPRATGEARLDALERREQILRHATRIFEQQPYADVRLGDIAAAAGVARPLVHHYFGTKRELYLEVLRRIAFIPIGVIQDVGQGPVQERIEASLERFTSIADRHHNMWISIITLPVTSGDVEVDRILRQADVVAAERMIQVLGLAPTGQIPPRLLSTIVAYGGMARASCREWLVEGTLTRADVKQLLSASLVAIIHEVVPDLVEAAVASG